jgi:hypothetical protein
MGCKVIGEFIRRIKIQEDMGAFTGTEFNARDDKRIKRIITGFKRPFDLVVIRNRNPNPEVFRPAEERGNTDRSIRIVEAGNYCVFYDDVGLSYGIFVELIKYVLVR